MKTFYVDTVFGKFEVAEPDLLQDAAVRENNELAEWVQNCKVADVWDEGVFVLQCVGEVTLH